MTRSEFSDTYKVVKNAVLEVAKYLEKNPNEASYTVPALAQLVELENAMFKRYFVSEA